MALGVRVLGLDWGLPEVYEEAYPFKRAWPMWGWEPGTSFDLNPHFFNYPSLYFYVQFIGQGLLYVLLRTFGVVDSILDYRVLYAIDKTPFYLMARSITILFALGTVYFVYRLGARVRGFTTGVAAAALVAVNHTHITKSQVVEVDVPLTFFLVACVYFCVRILDEPRPRHYVLAGLCAGLATSTKYSGMLLPLCILAAHAVVVWRAALSAAPAAVASVPATKASKGRASRRKRTRAAPTREAATPSRGSLFVHGLLVSPALLWAGLVCIVALLATSPYIVLDRQNFWMGFNYERLHLALGHFGQDESSTILYYARVMTDQLLGWPLTLTSVAALVYLVLVRRLAWAFVLCLFPIVYLTMISSFTMRAERYILPLMPLAAVLSVAFVVELLQRARPALRRHTAAIAAASAVVLALPSIASFATDRSRLRDDNRTLARLWIEENVPPGSYIVSEPYGPEPMTVIDLAGLSLDVRQKMTDRESSVPTYAMAPIPMLQVLPELTGVFYDPSLYDIVDYLVTSSSVESRYRKDPQRFPKHVAFYEALDRDWKLVRTFDADDGTGPRLKIYRNPKQSVPFSQRTSVTALTRPILGDPQIAGTIGRFFQRQALNLESYGFYEGASASYRLALQYPSPLPDFERDVTLGLLRCHQNLGQIDQAVQIAQAAAAAASSAEEARFWAGVRAQLEASR